MEILNRIAGGAGSATVGCYPENFIRFLGTAGTRFVMLTQRRASGGIWFRFRAAWLALSPPLKSKSGLLPLRLRYSPAPPRRTTLKHRF